MNSNEFNELFKIISKRSKSKDKNSYTLKLLKLGQKKIAQKCQDDPKNHFQEDLKITLI